MENGF